MADVNITGPVEDEATDMAQPTLGIVVINKLRPLTLKLVHIIARSGKPSYQFWCF